MVRAAAAAPAPEEVGLTEPSFRAIFGTGAAGLLREGVLPLGVFHVGLRFGDLATGIARVPGRRRIQACLRDRGARMGRLLAVTFVTGTPVMLLLLAWSIRFSIRSFSD